MNVGILTFHLGANYGGYLQAYCLSETIKQLGHDVEIINYKNRTHWQSGRFTAWVYRRPLKFWFDFQKHQIFERSFSKLPLSSELTTNPTEVDWNKYDAIVVGSDIVWNCEYPVFGRDPVYFGRFPVPYRGRLIGYAPSTGFMRPDYAAPSWVSEGLRQFHFIGVRDRITQQFVQKQTGKKHELVADPTWLCDATAHQKQQFSRRIPKDFLLVYSFQLHRRKAKDIRNFAREEGLRVIAAGYYQAWADENWGNLDPFEWIQLFRQAKYVVTGTFHGTLYSIREQAKFCVLSHTSIDAKVVIPLELTGLQDRHTSNFDKIGEILRIPISYGKVDELRKQYVQRSAELLKGALQ